MYVHVLKIVALYCSQLKQ